MSRLDKLIQELCPNGVEYKVLGELCNICTGKLNANAKDEDGIYPFFTCDANPYKINEYAFDTSAILISGNGSQVGHLNQYEGKFNAYQRTYVLDNFKLVIKPFLFHFMDAYLKPYIMVNCKKGSVPYITLPMLQSFNVPVPPLEVQCEIVRILDSFTLLTEELTEELTARKKQYQHYLNSFFENQKDNLVPLSSLGTITRGKRFVHADATETGVPCIHYGELYTFYGVHANIVKSHIREELRPKMRYAHKGDVIIVGAGENNIDIGVGVAWEGNEDVAVHDACYTLCHSKNSKYISYYLRSDMYHNQIKKYVSEGKICSISATGLGKALIPLPSIAEQERIVSILDRFDSLCNDITTGLPAEIEARQKQYEYYRDKLLTFKQL